MKVLVEFPTAVKTITLDGKEYALVPLEWGSGTKMDEPRNNGSRRYRPYTKEEVDGIMTDYNQGHKPRWLARKYHRTVKGIYSLTYRKTAEGLASMDKLAGLK